MTYKSLVKTCVIAAIFWVSNSFAVPFLNPDPDLGADIDNDGYFSQGTGDTFGVELWDVGGFDFGFYFKGAPDKLIQIFDPLDQDPGGANPLVFIDFTGGFVFDRDEGVVQSLFTGSAADFGFYLTLGGATVYSDPLLNRGIDWFGTFPVLTPDVPAGTFAPVFFHMGGQGQQQALYAAAIAFVDDKPEIKSTVDEPGTLLMFSLGSVLLALARRRSRSS